MPRGGKRPNQTGRPKNPEETKVVRVPKSIDIKALLQLRADLLTLLDAHRNDASIPAKAIEELIK